MGHSEPRTTEAYFADPDVAQQRAMAALDEQLRITFDRGESGTKSGTEDL